MSKSVEQAYARIREGILSGLFQPGQRLKESELVDLCGVSRTPVRAAISKLVSEEFLEAERNQGARVKDWQRPDIDGLFDLRTILEGHAAAKAAQHINAAQLQLIEQTVATMEVALKGSRGLTNLSRTNDEFLRHNKVIHKTIWDASNNTRLIAMLELLVEQSLQVRTIRSFSLSRLFESHQHHQDLLRALQAKDSIWAESVMRNHIRAARASLISDEENNAKSEET